MSARSLPSVCPAPRDARRRRPSRGARGPWFPTFLGTLRREDCRHVLLGALRSSLASRYRACFRWVRALPDGLVLWSKPPDHARAFGHPVPHSGEVTRRHVALPRARLTPVKPCPALRPRWGPAHSPSRLQACCLPVRGHRRLSPLDSRRDSLASTTVPVSGLHHAACLLVPSSFVRPLLGVHVECTSGLLARLWPGRT